MKIFRITLRLLDDICLPFWINNCIDQKYGGFTFCLGRDGTVIDSDKGIWTHGRFVWLLTLYHQKPEWLEHQLNFSRNFIRIKLRKGNHGLKPSSNQGEFFDHFDGRMLCPGHAIWFILNESIFRNHDPRLKN